MIETARKHNVVLMEAMKPTLTPAFLAIRDHIPEIGVVRRYFSCYCQYSSRYDKFKEGIVLNAFQPGLSNGSTMDIGVYTIYPMVVLFGRPKEMQVAGLRLSSGVDGQVAVHFTYDNGMTGTVLYGKIADSTLPTEIQGEQGTIRADRIKIIGEVALTRRKGIPENIRPDTPHHEYYYEVKEFIDIILSDQKESAINTHSNSLITMEILDEIRSRLRVVFPADDT
jgi:predicted dehydrogenase